LRAKPSNLLVGRLLLAALLAMAPEKSEHEPADNCLV
jgi:hypothetical protein